MLQIEFHSGHNTAIVSILVPLDTLARVRSLSHINMFLGSQTCKPAPLSLDSTILLTSVVPVVPKRVTDTLPLSIFVGMLNLSVILAKDSDARLLMGSVPGCVYQFDDYVAVV